MKKLIIVLSALTFALVAIAAHALTLSRVEGRIEQVQACMRRGDARPQLLIYFKTYDADGLVREVNGRDAWDNLTAQQQTNLTNVLNLVYATLYANEAIPTPTPTPGPTPTP